MAKKVQSIQNGAVKTNIVEEQMAKAFMKAKAEGKDPFKAAQKVAREMLPEAFKPKGKAEAAPEADGEIIVTRYVTAICRLGSGVFDGLSLSELKDVACLVKVPVNSARDWLELRKHLGE